MFISDELLAIIKNYNTNNGKAFDEVYNGFKFISSGLDKYKCKIAKLIHEQNLSDDVNDDNVNDLLNSLKIVKNYKNNFDSLICLLQEFSNNTLPSPYISSNIVANGNTTNIIGMVYLKVTTNEHDCPYCYKIERVPLEETQTRFKIFDDDKKCIGIEAINTMHCNKCNKFFITRDLYYNLKSKVSIKNTNLDISFSYCLPKEINYADFIVLSNIRHCSNANHHIKDIVATINVINNTGEIVLKYVNASYCQECDRFIVLKEDYKKLNGIPMCRIIDETRTTPNDNHFEGFDYSESDTLFFQRGYNVNCIDNLPKAQRQRILEQILIHHEISKAEICSYIDTLISRGEKIPNWNNAVKRWKEDREFVEQLQLPNLEKVSVRSITMK